MILCLHLRLKGDWNTDRLISKSTGISFADNNQVMLKTVSHTQYTAYGTNEYVYGRFQFEVIIEQMDDEDDDISIGVVPQSCYDAYSTASISVAIGDNLCGGWEFSSDTGLSRYNGFYQSYGTGYEEGDVVLVDIDFDNNAISFFVNDVSYGIAYSNVVGPIHIGITAAAIGCYRLNTCVEGKHKYQNSCFPIKMS